MRVLALLHEAFGGEGGIAQFNRDFLTAAAAAPSVDEVAVLLRWLPAPPGPLPPGVALDRRAAGGKVRYGLAALEAGLFGGRFGLVVCGHRRLLRYGLLAARLARAPLLLIAYGIDVWQAAGGASAGLVQRVDGVLSISELTKQKLLGWS